MAHRRLRKREGLPLHETAIPVVFRRHTHCPDVFVENIAEDREPGDADGFLDPNPALPNLLKQFPACRQACARLRRAVRNRERILIYSDYDCDGVVSLVIMKELFEALGQSAHRLEWVIPHRVHDGYGLSLELLKKHFNSREPGQLPKLVVALDCGSTAAAEVEWLRQQQVDVLVVDHHVLDGNHPLPVSRRVIHLNPRSLSRPPHQGAPAARLEPLCAAGLCLLLADAVMVSSRRKLRLLADRFTLLAGLATVADVVPLLGLNRALVKRSLRLAGDPATLKSLCPGLAAMEAMHHGADNPQRSAPDEGTYGFGWGPRLNAAGRMEHAEGAIRLLLAKRNRDAQRAANRLQVVNRWRNATEETIFNSARQMAAEQMAQSPPPALLLLCDASWHPGVVGIVASTVTREFNCPTILCAQTESGLWRGSGRSVPGCDLGNLFHRAKAAGLILGGGGHPMAGGLSFSEKMRPRLQAWLNRAASLVRAPALTQQMAEIPAAHFDPMEWHNIFRRLAPFGNGNPQPQLIVEGATLFGLRYVERSAQQETKEAFAFEARFVGPGIQRPLKASWFDLERADAWWNADAICRLAYEQRHRFLDQGRFRLSLGLRPVARPTSNAETKDGEPSKRVYFQILDCWRLFEVKPKPSEPCLGW